jgi:hypothetical protein
MRWLVVVVGLVGCGDAGAGAGANANAGGGVGANSGASADGGAGGDAHAPTDASPSDAGASDAGASDAGACFACDDFEHGTVGAPPGGIWSISTPNCSGTGSVAIDDAQAHGGSRSVKVVGAGGYCNHVFFATPLPARAVTWFRFFVRFDAPLGDGHTTFLAMRNADGKDLRMGGQNRALMFNRESDDATLPEMSPAGTAKSIAPAARTWTCIEVAIDTSAKTIRTWVDGAAIEGLVDDGIPTPDVDAAWLRGAWTPSLLDARFGWESYAGQADTLWFDDVAIGASRFGCEG